MFRFTASMCSLQNAVRGMSGSTRCLTVCLMWVKGCVYVGLLMIAERPEVYLDLEVNVVAYHPPSMPLFGLYDAPASFRCAIADVCQG